MNINLVRMVDQYLMSNSVMQTFDLGEMELLRKLLYNIISSDLDKNTLKQILAYCTKVFRGKTSFTKDLKTFSTRTFDLLMAKQRRIKLYQYLHDVGC
ncbi:hypothetical protein DC487_11000 [Sphingobacterium corticibacter]|uniref:Uncharacterized protein n=1 Tax=Sphingobacterium corticibacter TaxID=2171749 RepID=A0A2T8HJ80_9SPHI|nr:hypothetical protein DC487_11000 [Sphingobacterium corticibacter]